MVLACLEGSHIRRWRSETMINTISLMEQLTELHIMWTKYKMILQRKFNSETNIARKLLLKASLPNRLRAKFVLG